jgi:hypothetical protein
VIKSLCIKTFKTELYSCPEVAAKSLKMTKNMPK